MSPSRRGATSLSGVVLVDKPAGMTSHDVVSRVRRSTGEGRIGHAGTLDPMATGLLLVLIGPATRLVPYLTADDKTYEATITFGAATDTDDAEGAVTEMAAVPDTVFDPGAAQEVLHRFLGDQLQVPPTYSAIKTGGKTAHRVARAGGTVAVAPRPVRVDSAELLSIGTEGPCWRVRFGVSKGTYVRALARDIGRSMGTTAHLSALRRTRSGAYDVVNAHSLEEIAARVDVGLQGLFADPLDAFPDVQTLEADADCVLAGRPIEIQGELRLAVPSQKVAVIVDGGLGALYRVEGSQLVPEVVLSIPARRSP